MILLGCLLAFGLAVAPRVILILAWLFSERWPIVWGGDFLVPLLGIAFVPYTTVMYMLIWSPTGIQGWDWLWILSGPVPRHHPLGRGGEQPQAGAGLQGRVRRTRGPPWRESPASGWGSRPGIRRSAGRSARSGGDPG